MTRLGHGLVVADSLSQGWLETTKMVRNEPDGKAFHTVTRIVRPLVEDHEIRGMVDALLDAKGQQAIDTVANTIFPSAMASTSSSPEELVRRYTDAYGQMRRFSANQKGTYFGRIVAYPGPTGDADQLTHLIETLRREHASATPMSARYEVLTATSGELASGGTAAGETAEVNAPVFAPHRDTSRRAFPCLSLLSFQLDHGSLHLLAHYRYEYLVEKGYGNYLGLSGLLAYIAAEAGLAPGQLTIVAGRIQADASERLLATHLNGHWANA